LAKGTTRKKLIATRRQKNVKYGLLVSSSKERKKLREGREEGSSNRNIPGHDYSEREREGESSLGEQKKGKSTLVIEMKAETRAEERQKD